MIYQRSKTILTILLLFFMGVVFQLRAETKHVKEVSERGERTGSGGVVWACYDKNNNPISAELADYVELERLYQEQIFIEKDPNYKVDESGLTELSKVKSRLDFLFKRLERFSHESAPFSFYNLYFGKNKEFLSFASFLESRRPIENLLQTFVKSKGREGVFRIIDLKDKRYSFGLTKTPDFVSKIKLDSESNCKAVNIAVQDFKNRPRGRKVFIDNIYWKLLPLNHKVGLLAHEIVLWFHNFIKQKKLLDTEPVRDFVGIISSTINDYSRIDFLDSLVGADILKKPYVFAGQIVQDVVDRFKDDKLAFYYLNINRSFREKFYTDDDFEEIYKLEELSYLPFNVLMGENDKYDIEFSSDYFRVNPTEKVVYYSNKSLAFGYELLKDQIVPFHYNDKEYPIKFSKSKAIYMKEFIFKDDNDTWMKSYRFPLSLGSGFIAEDSTLVVKNEKIKFKSDTLLDTRSEVNSNDIVDEYLSGTLAAETILTVSNQKIFASSNSNIQFKNGLLIYVKSASKDFNLIYTDQENNNEYIIKVKKGQTINISYDEFGDVKNISSNSNY